MKRIIRATLNPVPSEREQKNALLARKIGAEGCVLLENDGVLPLNVSAPVALYGAGARHTCFGGTGSGECRPRYSVTIEEGLLNAGFSVTTSEFLDGLDREYAAAKKEWRKKLIKGLKKCKKTAQMDYAGAHPFLPPLGGEIVKRDDADVALYVLTRQAGEGADRKTEEGDYYIRKEEYGQLKALCASYRKVVLLLNTCGVIDLSFTKSLNLSAILLVSLAGMEAGNAAADVLSGRVAPSGRLTATWAERYEDYPSHGTFSSRGGNAREQDYTEDIYVGYRYFHANGVKPRYPFGYGLSYTRFEKTCKEIRVSGSLVSCRIGARNVGACAGRDAVQLYLSAPDGKLKKERASLAAFYKTKLLQAGEAEEQELSFDLRGFASYDEESACYLLEAGDYILYLGENAEELTAIGVMLLEKTVVTERCKNVCPLKRGFNLFSPRPSERSIPDLDKIVLDGDSFECVTHVYPKPVLKNADDRFAALSLSDKIRLLAGTSYLGATSNTVFGAAGYTTSRLVKRGIPNMPMTDGPQGLNVSAESLRPKQNLFHMPVLPEALRFGFLGWLSNAGAPKKRSKHIYYQYATAFPIETLAAQTFDCGLLTDMGRAVGEEMEELGVVFFLAPALNIHRNPLCGRNYEYYSEDPFLSGELAAAVANGVQEQEGCYATLKHFACNNSEEERNLSSSNLSERALREIYLKGFGIAVGKAKARNVMASYNKINGEYVCNSYALLTDVLRGEFGFEGLVMTDWFAAGHGESRTEKCIPAGCDLVMPGLPRDIKRIRRAYKKGEIKKEEIEISALRIFNAAVKQY